MTNFKFAIPLQQETAIAFQDSFEGANPTREARAWLYQILTKVGVDWSNIQGNGGITVKFLDSEGKVKDKTISLKELRESNTIPQNNPSWLPDTWNIEDIQSFEIQIGSTLIEKLRNVFGATRHGTMMLNNSVVAWESTRVVDPKEVDHDKVLKDTIRDSEKYEKFPLEKFLQGVLLKPILDRVSEHETKLIKKEFDEMYPEIEEDQKASSIPGDRVHKHQQTKG